MKRKKWYKNQKIIIPMFIVLGLFIIIGTSYALWQITLQQTDTNVITTGCLKLTLTEETAAINLAGVSPTSDEDGKKLTPYTFTIENTCTTDTNYVINLETTSTGDKILADNYVKAQLISDTNQLFLDKLLEKHINEEKVITDATSAYKLYQGTLGNKEKKQFSLRLWLDEDTEAVDSVMNATWQGKITVTGKFVQNSNLAKLQAVSSEYTEVIWNYAGSTTKIVFENTIHEIEGAIDSFNIASDKTDNAKKIMAYVVMNTDDAATLTIYIQGNGGVRANEDSSFWFAGFSALTTIEGLEYFNTSNTTNMEGMFSECSSLTSLNLNSFDTSQVISMSSMFYNCSSLVSLDLSSFNAGRVTDMSGMFSDCSSLTSLDLSNFDTSKVTSMGAMFEGCSSLTSLDLSNFDTSKVTRMDTMFYNCNSLTSLNLSSFNTEQVTTMDGMFLICSSLTNLDINSFDTSQVINMSQMFQGCSRLTSLDLSNFDTSKVTSMDVMFRECSSLTSLDLSNFDTSKVTSMNSMFSGCSRLTSLDLSNFNTSEVTDMGGMFSECSSLTSLDLSSFNTEQVTDMSGMFLICSSLTNLDINSFDTSQVINMSQMFEGCSVLLTTITISNPNTTSYSSMFLSAATTDGASIKVNCTSETNDLVDKMIKTKSSNSNVVKGELIS